MSHLRIFAGPHAQSRLRDEGLHAGLFRALIGASGGPKWFVLYGLDRYLFGEFFRGRQEPLFTLGSSAGAWRMCCLATAEPVAAIDRLAHLYSHETYSAQPTVAEITDKARVMLAAVLGTSGGPEIVRNPVFKTHLVADRCKGPGSSHHRLVQSLALGAAALSNVVSRKSLSLFFERTIFSTLGEASPWADLQDLDTCLVQLTEENLGSAMMASGSIPFVLAGERDIKGAPDGLYWDGGITDYHFDLPFHTGEELVLYPHFSPRVVPGWFDKQLPWRQPDPAHFANVVLVTPSAEFVAQLPFRKISDRADFQKLEYAARLAYWQEVLDQSKRIGEEFAQCVEQGIEPDRIEPLPFG